LKFDVFVEACFFIAMGIMVDVFKKYHTPCVVLGEIKNLEHDADYLSVGNTKQLLSS